MPPSQDSKSYSFKNVGITQQDATNTANLIPNERPIGIATPLQLGEGNDGLFLMHKKLLNQISDNLRNLINTDHGERVGLYDFGANLGPLTFNLGTDDIDSQAISRISAAVSKYMPYVDLQTFEPFVSRFNNREIAKVGVRVTFLVPSLGPTVRGIELMLYCAG
jgi:phage baseplate assembly protein W